MTSRRSFLARTGQLSALGVLGTSAGCLGGNGQGSGSNGPGTTATEATVDDRTRTTVGDETRTPETDAGADDRGAEDATPTDEATTERRRDEPADGNTGGAGGGQPDFGGYFDGDVDVVSRRGRDAVSVAVGAGRQGLSFDPRVVHVDSGATVRWEWTGEGGTHNVVAQDGSFDSGPPAAGSDVTFEHVFTADGVYNYICEPHSSLDMNGSVVVGSNYPTR